MISPNGNVVESPPASQEALIAKQLRDCSVMTDDPETKLLFKAAAGIIEGVAQLIQRSFDAGSGAGYKLRQREIDMQDEHIRNLEALYKFGQTAKCKGLLDHYLATKSTKFKSAIADELVSILDEYRHGNY